MFFRKFKIWFFAILAAAVLLGINYRVQKHLDRQIVQDKLIDEGSVQGLPPVVAFTTVALGGFRGILADILWLRVGSLQNEGKYFELVQLASWIMKLQPKFSGAASFLAWNMAYNVSVTFRSQEDRWRWVNRGIELLRDEALDYNPNDPSLYQQLGWIFQHKIGNVLDDAQRYYKYQIAKEMHRVYGGKPEPDWEALDKMPQTWVEFKLKHPEEKWWEPIRAVYADDDTLYKDFCKTGKLPEKLAETLPPEDALELENFLRAMLLRKHYKIRPEIVIELNKKYGHLDWRTSEAFAIYWATLGMMYSPNRKDMQCDRMISQSLKESFLGGHLLFPGEEPSMDFLMIPNLDIIDAVRESYLVAASRYKFQSTFMDALDNFMTDAIVTLYSYGREKKAREYFNIQRKAHPNKPEYRNFDQFVLAQWTDDMKVGSFRQGNDLINGLIFTSCLFLAYDDMEAGAAHLKLAEMAYQQYMLRLGDQERFKLPPFTQMKNDMVLTFMKQFPKLAPRLRGIITEEQIEEAEKRAEAAAKEKAGASFNPNGMGTFQFPSPVPASAQ